MSSIFSASPALEFGSHFLEGAPPGVVCPQCGACLDYEYAPHDLPKRTKRNADFYSTYDNRCIITARAAAFFGERYSATTIRRPVTPDAAYHYLLPRTVVTFDATRRGTRFVSPCHLCGRYESVVGATPAFLIGTPPEGAGVYRTDLAFGSGQEKCPLMLIESSIISELKRLQFTGLDFEAAEVTQ